MFLTSSGSPYSSRVARRGRVKYFWEPRIIEDSGVRAAPNRLGPQSPPKPRSPVPPFTSVAGVGSEGRGGSPGKPSGLPEEQPGHLDGHSPGSQDAEERAPESSAPERKADGGACIRFTPLLERAATELVTGTEASVRAPLPPRSYPAHRSPHP